MTTRDPLSDSQTFPSSDSENYDANHSNSQDSDDRPSTSSSPLILYSPPTFWSIIRGAAINLFLPFVNGLMLGFGELVAHEAAWRLGWGGTKVSRMLRWRKRKQVGFIAEKWRISRYNQQQRLTNICRRSSHRTGTQDQSGPASK